jgi:hypothetical protein
MVGFPLHAASRSQSPVAILRMGGRARRQTINPVRQIPQGKRPRQSAKRDMPWIDDDSLVRQLIDKLETPVNLMFYLGNRSGLRDGEISGFESQTWAFSTSTS